MGVRPALPVPTVVDRCHDNLLQVQTLVNSTVEMLATNVSQPQQAAPLPAQRALTVGQLHSHILGTDSLPLTRTNILAVPAASPI